jgi:hypothetical protein
MTDYLERVKEPATREYLYHLYNNHGHPYTDITFPFLVDIGSYLYFGEIRYIVEDWILPSDYDISDDDEEYENVIFVVYCAETNCDISPYSVASQLVRNNKIEKIL